MGAMSGPIGSHDGITALLGPTNTGKTHRATARMLEHESGMIGLPLRLLAREVYDRVTEMVGEQSAALVTGEEKRVPKRPRYWICTAEAMPLDREVDFLAVDEIQLSTHPERGHIFTDRLLYARGRRETWFLGSESVRALLEQLVPTATVHRHPRLSQLRAAPPTGLSRLRPRSAVVAFSATRVYEIAERLRRRRGGAAIVLGALSPRTRNAQVAMYQSGEVDYLVATDAIGMGLNLRIQQVAFADREKFDGQQTRPLELVELGQIAGRAGRYLEDGSFAVLSPLPAFAPYVVHALEQHRFPAERQLVWRNRELDYSSVEALLGSLGQAPGNRHLRRVQRADDSEALSRLVHLPEIRRLVRDPHGVELLWQVCQVPDYRQRFFELHVKLLERLYLHLSEKRGQLDTAWIDESLRGIDDTRGDIDTLMGRIADIRTWTYLAHRPGWIADAHRLQRRTRDIEDRLSDALHEALVLRFVDRSRSLSLPRPGGPARLPGGNHNHLFASLLADYAGLASPQPSSGKRVAAERIDKLVDAPHELFHLDSKGEVAVDGHPLARLVRGPDLLHPEVRLRSDAQLGAGAQARLRRRMVAYCRDLVSELLAPLRDDRTRQLAAPARGLVYQLEQGLGSVRRGDCEAQIQLLSQDDRELLGELGVRIGHEYVYLPLLLGPLRLEHRAALLSAATGLNFAWLLEPGVRERGSLPHPVIRERLVTAGFVVAGPAILGLDVYERLREQLERWGTRGRRVRPERLSSLSGYDAEMRGAILEGLGFRRGRDGGYAKVRTRSRRRRRRRGTAPSTPAHSPADTSSNS